MCAFGNVLLWLRLCFLEARPPRNTPGWRVGTELPIEAGVWPTGICSMRDRLPPQAARCPWVGSYECAYCATDCDVLMFRSRIAGLTDTDASSTCAALLWRPWAGSMRAWWR